MYFISDVPKLLAGLLAIWLLLVLPAPAQAATTSPERMPLTLEVLQERLNSPIQSDGAYTIDLRQLIIDLTRENSGFRDQFYQQVQTQLNRSKTPLGLDLSGSLIQGEFTTSRLGLRSPLSEPLLSPLLTSTEKEQLQRDARFFSEPIQQNTPVTIFRGSLKLIDTRFTGVVNFSNTFFLHRVEALGVTFIQEGDWSDSRFARAADFSRATFGRDVNFSRSDFFAKAGFSYSHFLGLANFTSSTFQTDVSFREAEFDRLANLSRVKWLQTVDFSDTIWRDRSLLNKSYFAQFLLLTNAIFEKSTTFRDSEFQQPVQMSGVSLLDQVDFSNARFAEDVYLNVAGMTFDSDQAKIFGDSGQIGRVFCVPKLQGNEDVLRNLVRNFRLLQEIADANQLDYTTQRLRQQQLGSRLIQSNIKTPKKCASCAGISADTQHDGKLKESVDMTSGIGEEVFKQISQQTASPAPKNLLSPLGWVLDALSWVGLSLLLLLSRYGTSFWLVFGVGMVAIAYFGLLFWLVDRFRRRYPQPIAPTVFETPWMLGSYGVLTAIGVTAIFRTTDRPWLTLLCLGGIVLPVPMLLLWRLYEQGRYHDLMDVSYFVEDGSLRQLRLLIGRLPVMPRFSMFRDRYMPILWNRRWNWLNYFDFSLNNLLKLGFNDIRLRDEHLPGLITTLVWYQWSLGILYIVLLLWTLSRTIPGLNLLIYLK